MPTVVAPVLAAIGPQSVDEGASLNFATSATDANGDSLIMTALNVPANATFVDNFNGTGTFNFNPTFTQAGVYNVTFIVTDTTGLADSELVAITVNNVNRTPVLTAIGAQNVAENANLNFVVTATDADSDPITLTALPLPSGATFVDNGNGTGTFDWTPSFFQDGVYNVTFQAADTSGGVDPEVVSITVTNVNRDPILDPIGAQAVAEGVNLNFLVTSSDLDNDVLTLTTSALPAGATFIDNGNGTGTFDWTPGFTQAGAYAVTFLVADTAGGSDFESVSFTVTRTNVDPVLATIGAQSTSEDVNLNFGVSSTDINLDPIVLTASPLPSGASFVDNGNGTGTFNWTPDFTQSGGYNVTFRATDSSGAEDSEVVPITVLNVNRAPTISVPGSQSVDEGTSLNFGVSATDPDLTTPALSAFNVPVNATFLDNGDGTGTFDFNPDTTQAGVYNVSFIASDGSSADTGVVQITVINVVNLVPVLAAIGPKSIAENANLNFGVSATDSESDPIILSAVPLPVGASFVDNGDGTGSFNWTPGFFQESVYNVSFRAFDTLGRADSEVVAITVTNTNRDPVLSTIGPQTVAENVNLNFGVTSSDADNDLVALTTTALPAGATFVDNGNGTGTFDWTPTLSQEGGYAVTFLVTDTAGGTDFELVNFTVTRTNVTPVLTAIGAQSVDEVANLNFGVSASDFDLDPITLTAAPLPAGASFRRQWQRHGDL